jgi:hypothetical protein
MYTQVEGITLHQLFGRLHIQMIDLIENDARTKHNNLFCQSTKDQKSLRKQPPPAYGVRAIFAVTRLPLNFAQIVWLSSQSRV